MPDSTDKSRMRLLVGWGYVVPLAAMVVWGLGWWSFVAVPVALGVFTSVYTDEWIRCSLLLPGRRRNWTDVTYVTAQWADWAAKGVVAFSGGGDDFVMGSYRFTKRGVIRVLARICPPDTPFYVLESYPRALREYAEVRFRVVVYDEPQA